MMNSTSLWEATQSSVAPSLAASSNIHASRSSAAYDYSDYYDSTMKQNYSGICPYQTHGVKFLPALYSIFFLVGFMGNMLVLWVILMGAQMKSMTDVCLLNLAVADLLLVLPLPFLAHHANSTWVFGETMCFLVLCVYHIGFYSGIFFIVLMSIDRYLAVVHAVFALRVRTKIYGILASAGVWIAAIVVSFPELSFIGISSFGNDLFCTAFPSNQTHNAMKVVGYFKMNILGLLIPLAIVIYCYSMVLRRLVTVRTSKKHAVRLVIVVMAVFFLCWTPYNAAAFVKALELKNIFHTNCESSKTLLLMVQLTEAMAYSHSCLNPFLYVFVGQKFKKHLTRLLRHTPCFKLHFMKSYMTTSASVYSQTTSVDDRSTAL